MFRISRGRRECPSSCSEVEGSTGRGCAAVVVVVVGLSEGACRSAIDEVGGVG